MKNCSNCFNMKVGGCAVMNVPSKEPPEDYFCWATADMQLKRERDILNYSLLWGSNRDIRKAMTIVGRMEVLIGG